MVSMSGILGDMGGVSAGNNVDSLLPPYDDGMGYFNQVEDGQNYGDLNFDDPQY